MLAAYYNEELTEAGIDEAGRGCLAGPVFAAAVILPKNFSHPFLNDSKQLSEQQRNELRPVIESSSLAWAVASADHQEIDKINILQATYLAMHRCLDQLSMKPQLLLVDGNRFKPYKKIPFECMVKGDGRFMSIAAASILAKTYRDAYMLSLHHQHPQYGWDQNKGYGTEAHRAAILEHGFSPWHRRSFKMQLSLF